MDSRGLLLDHPYREDSRVIETLVIAESCQRILRRYQPELETQGMLSHSLMRMLDLRYPTEDELRYRDIRYHLAQVVDYEQAYYGLGSFLETVDKMLGFLDLQLLQSNSPAKKVRALIIKDIKDDVVERFQHSDSTLTQDIGSDPLYPVAFRFLLDSQVVGNFLAKLFCDFGTNAPPQVYLATRVHRASMTGRPVLFTGTDSDGVRSITFNCQAFNAYFQYFLALLFFHEYVSHAWSNFVQVPSLALNSPVSHSTIEFEEAFVHWTAVHYLKHFYFSEVSESHSSRIEAAMEEIAGLLTDSPSEHLPTYDELRQTFEVYENYFQNGFRYRSSSFVKACKAAQGLRSSVQKHLVRDFESVDQSWEVMRRLVVDLNSLRIPCFEKTEVMNTLYYLVAPFGEKIVWQLPNGTCHEVQITQTVYDAMGREMELILNESKSPVSVLGIDAVKLIQTIREVERKGTVEQILGIIN